MEFLRSLLFSVDDCVNCFSPHIDIKRRNPHIRRISILNESVDPIRRRTFLPLLTEKSQFERKILSRPGLYTLFFSTHLMYEFI
jgi:hypothetical protein